MAAVGAPHDLGKPLPAAEAVVRRGHRLPPPAVHLGAFDGRRKRGAPVPDESYGLTKALLSLMAVTAFLFCAALVLGAV